jgi:nucleotide-binding universal stress UspA family protein
MSEAETRENLRILAEDKINSLSETQKNNISINYRFEYGYPEDVIPKVCAQQGCDVVIMGTKTKDETLKELLGNVTNDVIHKVSVPVLAIPAHSTIDLSRIGKVLFITEFKEQDYFSMDRLIRIISAFNTEIHAIHFCQKREEEMDVTRMEQFKLYCESTYRNHPILFRNFTGKEFVSTLEKYVADHDIDIMAMTHKKRNVLQRLFGTEKTRKMLFHTDIPLLVFHS